MEGREEVGRNVELECWEVSLGDGCLGRGADHVEVQNRTARARPPPLGHVLEATCSSS